MESVKMASSETFSMPRIEPWRAQWTALWANGWGILNRPWTKKMSLRHLEQKRNHHRVFQNGLLYHMRSHDNAHQVPLTGLLTLKSFITDENHEWFKCIIRTMCAMGAVFIMDMGIVDISVTFTWKDRNLHVRRCWHSRKQVMTLTWRV